MEFLRCVCNVLRYLGCICVYLHIYCYPCVLECNFVSMTKATSHAVGLCIASDVFNRGMDLATNLKVHGMETIMAMSEEIG